MPLITGRYAPTGDEAVGSPARAESATTLAVQDGGGGELQPICSPYVWPGTHMINIALTKEFTTPAGGAADGRSLQAEDSAESTVHFVHEGCGKLPDSGFEVGLVESD